MDFRRNDGRPVRPQERNVSAPVATQSPGPGAGVKPATGPGVSNKKWLYISAAAAVLIGIAVVSWSLLQSSPSPRSDRYQAVFLDNDQVFFGKLKNVDGNYLRLEQAYSTRQESLPDEAQAQNTTPDNNVSLVKVGDLVYGPENVMMIRAEKVKFWQDLKSDSKISKAIDGAQ